MHIRKYSFRFILVFVILIVFLGIFAVRLVFLQIFGAADLLEKADQQHNLTIELEPVRGGIYDRRGRPFAFNVSVYSLYANPRLMSAQDKKEALQVLPKILGLEYGFLKERLSRAKYFVWIKRKLTLDVVEKIKSCSIGGLGFMRESKRFYPNAELGSHMIGFAGIDNHGLEGIELAYDKELVGVPGKAMVLRDAHQRELMLDKNYVAPVDGFNVNLTIDETIQYLAEEALDKMFKKKRARAASI
ncbi:MAG: hypothetical protein Q8O19_07880, partial [Rectinemataceae bacterium]|nr:hypothetical protein [Rectinemataceae bacterium]